MKNLFIRCDQDTYDLAKALAEKENRSVNKQIIHMIHTEADARKLVTEDRAEQEGKEIYSGGLMTSDNVGFDANGSPVYDDPVKESGLSELLENKKQVRDRSSND